MPKELIIVGTSHIAKQSSEKVRKIIDEDMPDVVGVELDLMRYKSLISKEHQKQKQGTYSSIRRVGVKGFVFASIGSFATKRLAKYVGTDPGVDMLEAVRVAHKNKIKVYLIDQNIDITLSKFSKSLTAREIGRFFLDMIKGIFNPKGELKKLGIKRFDLNTVPGEEIIEKMIAYMKKRYPSVYKVLVHQRNIVMSKRIMKLMELEDVNKMVAVVGAGHQAGMKKILEEQANAAFTIKIT